jgi:hypothetical protein
LRKEKVAKAVIMQHPGKIFTVIEILNHFINLAIGALKLGNSVLQS